MGCGGKKERRCISYFTVFARRDEPLTELIEEKGYMHLMPKIWIKASIMSLSLLTNNKINHITNTSKCTH